MVNIAKATNPTTFLRVRRCDNLWAVDVQGPRMVTGGIGWVREHLLPSLEVIRGMKTDDSEKVSSCSRDPRLGDEAALLQYILVTKGVKEVAAVLVMNEVNDVVEYLWREATT